MPGRRVDLLPVTSYPSPGTFVTEVRFAVPTGRAKSGRLFVNMFRMTGSGSVTAQAFTATDLALDPNQGTAGADPAFWIAANTALSFAIATPELGTKATDLTVLGDWLRIAIVVPAASTARLSAVAFLYDA